MLNDAASSEPGQRASVAVPWWPASVTTTAAVTLLGVVALPWLRSGTTRRSSFELFDLVDRLGFAPGGFYSWAVRLWPIVPLGLVCTVVAAWWGRGRLATVLGVISGLYSSAVGFGTRQAPDAGLVAIESGALVAGVGGLALAITVLLPALVRKARAPAR